VAVKGIGVALSGGGHRASLFGLGALLYLGDAGKLPQVTSVASVSGGSLTNGWIAQSIDLSTAGDGAMFAQAMAPFAKQLAQRGTLFATPFTWVYVVVLAATGLVALVVPWLLPLAGILQFLVLVAVLLGWAGLVASRRSWVAATAFRRTLFSPTGSPTLLAGVHGGLDHVFCATDLQSAEQVYFAQSFGYGYRFGVGTPADLALHDAVQASACLPGAFPPRWLRAQRFSFGYPDDAVHPDDPCPDPKDRPAEPPAFLILTDGGAYDNMADQWAIGRRGRAACFPDPDNRHPEPQQLIVVNASAGRGWARFNRSQVPGLGELLSLLRIKDVLVNIPRSPFDLAGEFAGFQDAAGTRAKSVLATLATPTPSGSRSRPRTRG
jgi:hypothetical protein